ncbi:type I-E CRISPR-associated protein Cas6/Cse3/CasE [Coraliomargarita algicola]|uniref:Type I-E CRISPR-associated protein Cas6/Cse3/CasE n=1 Tax=Coraliomargarita algicola TaxID=3092156 RepID=A0ABZ0RK72_9BACT|nr:type I-E CRISPR-associated protein Cas6/Cse3/CasE [Coraliomargarita sp. J2-16]WPJ95664.1 type I-E CRISPR-associated protein Cas6/Cse3/CasE [Coraliomargarita sp. J2-16]
MGDAFLAGSRRTNPNGDHQGMILTQAQIPYDITAREWKDGGFRDSYAWHKRVWEAFPGQAEAERNFLTRLDDTGHGFRLLILSADPPTRPDWCPSEHWHSKSVEASFFQHRAYRFSLLANPTKKLVVRDADGVKKKNGKRIALSKREDLIEWIERKAAQHGFSVDTHSLKMIPRPRQQFLKKGKSGTHTVTEYTGQLQVIDNAAFKQAAIHGIGSAKAFGFGMLCLVPLTTD